MWKYEVPALLIQTKVREKNASVPVTRGAIVCYDLIFFSFEL